MQGGCGQELLCEDLGVLSSCWSEVRVTTDHYRQMSNNSAPCMDEMFLSLRRFIAEMDGVK